ncbi:MAG: YHS domain-containing (seleno)protein [Pseudomonadota bacterium]
MTRQISLFIATTLLAFAGITSAYGNSINTVAVQGYDVVSYHQGDGTPAKGNGGNVAYFNDEIYLFSNAENKATFEASPQEYVPAYGGYCAFGVTGGRKFVGDPLAYRVVDGTLYLNLSKQVQERWIQNIPGNIERADQRWPAIKDTHPADL